PEAAVRSRRRRARGGAVRGRVAGGADRVVPPQPAEHEHGQADARHAGRRVPRGAAAAGGGGSMSHHDGDGGGGRTKFPDDPGPWQVLSREYLARKEWFTVHVDHVRLPTGAEIREYW